MRQRTRLIINVLSNYGTFVLYGIANFVLVGYVVRVLGKEMFGLASLVISLTVFTDLVGRGICQALTKHVAAEASLGNKSTMDRYASSSFAWFLFSGFIAAVAVVILGCYVEKLFEIPADMVRLAKQAMWLMALKVFICFPFSTFQGILWGYQRYDLANIARSVAVLTRLFGTILCFEFIAAGIIPLIIVSIISFIVERVIWVVSSIIVSGGLHLKTRSLSWKAFLVLAGFGSFMLVIHASNLLGYEAVKWVVGAELSITDVGGYTLIATMAAFAGSVVRSVANVLTPVASRLNSLEQHDIQARLAGLSTKYAMIISSGLCLAPVLLLKPFLILWVGSKYSEVYLGYIALVGSVLLVGQWFITTAVCLLQMLTGIGKVKFPAVITLTWALGGLSGIWIYLRWANGSLLGAVVGITIARIIGSIIHLIYGITVLRLNPKKFIFTTILRPGCVGLVVCVVGGCLLTVLDVYVIGQFTLAVAILIILYLLGTWVVSLSSSERNEAIVRLRFLLSKLNVI